MLGRLAASVPWATHIREIIATNVQQILDVELLMLMLLHLFTATSLVTDQSEVSDNAPRRSTELSELETIYPTRPTWADFT
jgi:hypothetical protein